MVVAVLSDVGSAAYGNVWNSLDYSNRHYSGDHMTTSKNWQGDSPPKKAADPGKTTTSRGGGNWVNGDTGRSKPDYARKPQVNFEGSIEIPVKFEKGQGQKSGTGCNGGY
jgi:hypothetical protein